MYFIRYHTMDQKVMDQKVTNYLNDQNIHNLNCGLIL